MQKKLIAVAVAGALGAPAAVLAQNATINVYGKFYAEYGKVFQGNQNVPATPTNPTGQGGALVDVDILQTPGSMIGFRGEEKLGGGLSAWFQCETTADFRGQAGQSSILCARNSALGLKGGFGNVFLGTWDTPFKRVIAKTGANGTGLFGASFVLFGNNTTTNSALTNSAAFERRQRNSINYDSPSFGGFKVMGSYSNLNTQTNTVNSATGSKPRILSIGAQYKNGPINAYAAYQKHKDIRPAFGGDDKGWVVGAEYTFAKRFKVGGLYSQQKAQVGAAADTKVSVWHIGADAHISGPHGVRASYSQAGDMKGTAGAGSPGSGRPGVGANTGAQFYQIRYYHKLSKRTELTAGYAKVKNEGGARYQLGGLTNNALGNDPSAVAIALEHRF